MIGPTPSTVHGGPNARWRNDLMPMLNFTKASQAGASTRITISAKAATISQNA